MVEDRLKTARNSFGLVIVLVSIASNVQMVESGPSAQQEHELLLLDALSRKQINNLNAISHSNNNNNYETNAIMDMLGRSMLNQQNQNVSTFAFS